jgi:uncharacterized protein with HEPN domain
MPSDAAIASLRDMAHNIDLATDFVAGLNFEAFREDTRTVYAVGAGNVYRHDYEDVTARLVWDTVQVALPPLRDVVTREIASFE